MLRAIAVVFIIAPAVLALVDMVQTRPDPPRVMPRFVWLLLIAVLPLVGPIAWLLWGSPRRTAVKPPPSVAPDDDDEFLAKLDKQRYRHEQSTTDHTRADTDDDDEPDTKDPNKNAPGDT